MKILKIKTWTLEIVVLGRFEFLKYIVVWRGKNLKLREAASHQCYLLMVDSSC